MWILTFCLSGAALSSTCAGCCSDNEIQVVLPLGESSSHRSPKHTNIHSTLLCCPPRSYFLFIAQCGEIFYKQPKGSCFLNFNLLLQDMTDSVGLPQKVLSLLFRSRSRFLLMICEISKLFFFFQT